MPLPGNPPLRIKIVTGWRAVVLAAIILVAIAVLAISTLVIIVPILIVGAVAAFFLPMSKIGLFRRTRRNADGVIEGEYKVMGPTQIERKDGASFDQSDGAQ